MNTKKYTAPVVEELEIKAEGLLCQSAVNEDYSADPSDDSIIF